MKEAIAFEIFEEEVDFLEPQIVEFHRRYPSIPILMLTRDEKGIRTIAKNCQKLRACGTFTTRRQVEVFGWPPTRLFVTSEQWKGIPGVPSYCSFHGQPAKGLTIQPGHAIGFNGFLLLGPLQKKVIEDHYVNNYGDLSRCPKFYEVGYPKSDALINGAYSRDNVLAGLGLPDRPTVLYAPAFNEHASMREQGPQILRQLLSTGRWNVLAKLAVDCWHPTSNLYANGGVNWFEELGKFEKDPCFRLYRETKIDSLLAASDVLVTCVSSVAFEFLVLGKPVVYIDTPKFFSHYLKMYFPHEDTVSWAERTGVNGGREFGTLVRDIKELIPAVEKAIEKGYSAEFAEKMRKELLYNTGRGTEATVRLLKDLHDQNRCVSISDFFDVSQIE